MIVIIDYDMGNVGSVANMIKKVDGDSIISNDLSVIEKAQKLILPGVGSFDTGMQNIKERGMLELLNKKVLQDKTPILGICLGMQLLTTRSEEGVLPGLGWIDGETIKFPADMQGQHGALRVPHMGWNYVRATKADCLLEGMFENPRFYFVHSYYVKCRNAQDTLCETSYGITFTSAVQHDNIWGMQFHPEKSHKYGMKVYRNFVHNI